MSKPTDDEIKKVYEWALKHADAEVPRPREANEAARDAATDGVVWAVQNYDAAKGDFTKFARSVVRGCIKTFTAMKGRHKNRPKILLLNDLEHSNDGNRVERSENRYTPTASDRPIAGNIPMDSTINDLPEELQIAVRLYLVDGYDFRECGMLLGVAAETVRARLRRAAEILAPEMTAPPRRNGEKRLANSSKIRRKSGGGEVVVK